MLDSRLLCQCENMLATWLVAIVRNGFNIFIGFSTAIPVKRECDTCEISISCVSSLASCIEALSSFGSATINLGIETALVVGALFVEVVGFYACAGTHPTSWYYLCGSKVCLCGTISSKSIPSLSINKAFVTFLSTIQAILVWTTCKCLYLFHTHSLLSVHSYGGASLSSPSYRALNMVSE